MSNMKNSHHSKALVIGSRRTRGKNILSVYGSEEFSFPFNKNPVKSNYWKD